MELVEVTVLSEESERDIRHWLEGGFGYGSWCPTGAIKQALEAAVQLRAMVNHET